MPDKPGLIVLLILATILLLLVVKSIWKAFSLLNNREMGSNETDRISWWLGEHQAHLFLYFLIFFGGCVVISTLYYSSRFLPSPALVATQTSAIFNATSVIVGIAFFVTHILLFSFVFNFRKAPHRTAKHIRGSFKLELTWTLIPLVSFVLLFIWGQAAWSKITTQPPGNPLTLDVVGEQFNWMVRYPGADQTLGRISFRLVDETNRMGIDVSDPHSQDDFVPLQMHIPKGETVKLILRSRDVIHSFYIPMFKMKMDAVPGMTTNIHFTATVSTDEMRQRLNDPEFNYEIACAELCGRMHFAMKLILVVDEPEQFDEWQSKQRPWVTSINTQDVQ